MSETTDYLGRAHLQAYAALDHIDRALEDINAAFQCSIREHRGNSVRLKLCDVDNALLEAYATVKHAAALLVEIENAACGICYDGEETEREATEGYEEETRAKATV